MEFNSGFKGLTHTSFVLSAIALLHRRSDDLETYRISANYQQNYAIFMSLSNAS